MFTIFALYSPLEQFQILPLIPLYFGVLDVSITNESVILSLILIITILFYFTLLKTDTNTYFVIPLNEFQSAFEILFKFSASLITDNIRDKKKGVRFFPFIFFSFLFIMSLNIIGLIPYSFTVTSHLIITFGISISVSIGINIICLKLHGTKMLSIFVAEGVSLPLVLLLVPIEMMSHLFRPISLSVRLFINMMTGHILIHVIAGFIYAFMTSSSIIIFLMHYIPSLFLVPLFGLEFAVALIQSFVFSVLICIYLNHAINLH